MRISRIRMYASAFGRNAFNPPDLSSVEMHGDRGYFPENSFVGILLLTGCLLTCTCPKGKWLPYAVGNGNLKERDNRIPMQESGVMTCEVREKVFCADDCQMKLTAFRNGNGKVILVASSIHCRLTIDFITMIERYGELWHKNKEQLVDLSFGSETSQFSGDNQNEVHTDYLELYRALLVTVVVTFQGHCEWHIAWRLSLTLTTTHALIKIKALLQHFVNLEFKYVRVVCEVMCPNYKYCILQNK